MFDLIARQSPRPGYRVERVTNFPASHRRAMAHYRPPYRGGTASEGRGVCHRIVDKRHSLMPRSSVAREEPGLLRGCLTADFLDCIHGQ